MTAKDVTRADVRSIRDAVLRHQLAAEDAASQTYELRALANAETPVIKRNSQYLWIKIF